MPRVFDNIETYLIKALQETLAVSDRAVFVWASSICAIGNIFAPKSTNGGSDAGRMSQISSRLRSSLEYEGKEDETC